MKYIRGRIIDGTGKAAIENGIIAIQGERIAAVGAAPSFEVAPDEGWVDLGDVTILPGMFDAHVHVGLDLEARRQSLLSGITSLCDLGTPLLEMAAFKSPSLEIGFMVSRGFLSGPVFTAPGGLPGALFQQDLNVPVNSSTEVQAGVLDLAFRGANVIKVYLDPWAGREFPVLQPDLLNQIVDQAHRMGLLVRAHVNKIPFFEMALDAGVDVLEHVPLPHLTEVAHQGIPQNNERNKLSNFHVQWGILDGLLPRAAAKGVLLVPTLSKLETSLRGSLIPKSLQRDVFHKALDTVRDFYQMGGRIALGTDRNARWEKPFGMPLREMDLLHQAGLPAMDVIRATTAEAAYVSGQADDLGTLEVGKLADLVVVQGDPLESLHALEKVKGVFLGGREVNFPDN